MEDNKGLLDFMTEALDGKVKAVRLSQRLKSHPVCISSEGAITLDMEKVLNAMPATKRCRHSVCWSSMPTTRFLQN